MKSKQPPIPGFGTPLYIMGGEGDSRRSNTRTMKIDDFRGENWILPSGKSKTAAISGKWEARPW
ncbi:hypothetical protein [Rhizobium sullae]|uniref:hypothetical protein n=1 Tax=Rhizobium sullae TaxID=50338 RepID=UPI0015C65232|nr:hypothetical protein [Rhizobium sullae]